MVGGVLVNKRPEFQFGWWAVGIVLVNKRREFRIGLRAVGVVLVNKRREFRFLRCQCGEGAWDGEGKIGDEVWGHVGGGEARSGLSYAADFGPF